MRWQNQLSHENWQSGCDVTMASVGEELLKATTRVEPTYQTYASASAHVSSAHVSSASAHISWPEEEEDARGDVTQCSSAAIVSVLFHIPHNVIRRYLVGNL